MFAKMFQRESVEVCVIDEGDAALRRRNRRLLDGLIYRFHGPRERKAYFSKTFGRWGVRASRVIPTRCHAETSFGFLLAYEEQPDIVLELDDDTFPVPRNPIIDGHLTSIGDHCGKVVTSLGGWYNTLDSLRLNEPGIFPRGHPYHPSARSGKYHWTTAASKVVLNMGLWLGHPDLDALTILSRGGLNGKCDVRSTGIKEKQLVVGRGTYFSLCSMNVGFRPEIIPAFYQLYMNYMGIDRFDDIWSGILFKKVADHLGAGVSLGRPVVRHQKRCRDVFKDLGAEVEGMAINDSLCQIVHRLTLEGNDYWTTYRSLCSGLEPAIAKMSRPSWRKFLAEQVRKMRIWLSLIDRL
jgi:hypothetical protein